MQFREKPKGDNAWINGGFFVLEPGVFDFIEGDQTIWEREPMQMMAQQGQLAAYRHQGTGRTWTRCVIKIYSRVCGKVETRHGKSGNH
jgi:NDP-sugar pyrophosphorylase family protein